MNLTQLQLEVRRRSDMENSQFIKDIELTTYINQSYVELYDLLVSIYEDYFVTDFTDKVPAIATVTGDGTTITVTCSSNHNLITGLQVTMTGWTGGTGVWDGQVFVTVVDPLTFTYPNTGNGTATGGTISVQNLINISTGNIMHIPSDFYKLRGLDRSLGGIGAGDWLVVKSFNFAERNKMNRQVVRNLYGQLSITYRLFGDHIELRPEDTATGFYRMWYIPRYTPLILATDEPTGVMDFEEYIIVDAAIKCLAKEESDTSVLMAQKQLIMSRVKTMASSRDGNDQEKCGDVRNVNFDWEFPYLR